MPKITCKIISHSNSRHLQHIFTGLVMLRKKGQIELTQNISSKNGFDASRPYHLRDARRAHLRMILNDGINVHYDAHDSWEIDQEYLKKSDFYFKRSYSLPCLDKLNFERDKIFPLGMIYHVFPDNVDKFAIERSQVSENKKEELLTLIHALNVFNSFKFAPRAHLMESLPDYDVPPKILFMARAWDPYGDPCRSKEKEVERNCINETRANCIRLLRNEFSGDFKGGFSHTEYSIKNYKDVLLADNKHSSKKNYIDHLKSSSICVATTGLHGSIGFKLPEYVAFSKAILSERLNYEVPGNFEEGKNYLAFSSPEECVEKAKRLFEDRELRNYLMTNNSEYYQSYLKPDALVLNTINIALSKSS